jgi:phage terminase large subunit GpA-like protein
VKCALATRIAYGSLAEAMQPDPRLTVSEWADAHRRLSSVSSAESGPWRTDRTPYLREIMDALSATSPILRVVFCKGAQIGGTECGNNWIGYTIAHAPGPMLCLMPTDKTAEANVRLRIDPLIDGSPAIRDRVPKRGSKEGGNTLDRKDFPGGVINIRGANAPANLRSLPIQKLFFDEVDAYQLDLDGEGDPIALARVRANTFGATRKEFMVSTPTIEGQSRIMAAFLETDQRYYFVPCPHCGEFQTIEWARIKWDGETSSAWLECEQNGCVIEERHKPRMLSAGEWRATAECADLTVRGYHISALYSPLGWYSWSQARDEFLDAKKQKDHAKLKTWVNTCLGQCWAEKGESPPWEALFARREPYQRNHVQAGGLVLTAGADVQKDRIEVEIRAWGPRLESWSVDKRVIAGDPSRLDGDRSPWPAMDALMSESWAHELGGRIGITTMAVDTGGAGEQTQATYNWARKWPPSRVMAVKGGSEATAALIAIPKKMDVRADGKVIPNGVTLWIVGTSIAKSELYGWLRQPRPEPGELSPTGWIHWPGDYDEEHFKQLTAEQLVSKITRGFRTYHWEKMRERNEALDLHVYNRVAAAQIGVDRFEPRRWDQLRAELSIVSESGVADREASTAHAKVRPKRSGSGYWSR